MGDNEIDCSVATIVLFVVVIIATFIYNALVRAYQMVKAAWSSIDLQLRGAGA